MQLERKQESLDRANDITVTQKGKTGKKKKPVKKKKSPFKKGSWKHILWKASVRKGAVKYMEDFHFTKMSNILIEKDGKWKTFNKRLKKSQLEKLSTKDNSSFVLIRGDSFGYYRLSIRDYLKMTSIENIAIHVGINLIEDGCFEDDGEEPFFSVVMDSDYIITSINQLANMIAELSSSAMILNNLQMRDWWYNVIEIDVRGVINYTDGSKPKTFKFDNFSELYKLFAFK